MQDPRQQQLKQKVHVHYLILDVVIYLELY
jgi:hypothetical protein